jgi:hypothetical protein
LPVPELRISRTALAGDAMRSGTVSEMWDRDGKGMTSEYTKTKITSLPSISFINRRETYTGLDSG